MIKKILLILIVLIVAAIFLVPGMLIKGAVESFGSDLLQTEVKLKSAKLSILSGDLILEGLEIANPEGFKSKNALYVGNFDITIDIKSLLSDTIHVKDIKLTNSTVAYEKTATSDNLTALKEKYGQSYKENNKSVTKSTTGNNKKSEKTIIIDHLLIDDIMVNLSLSVAGKNMLTAIPMPKIEMKDIGKNNAVTIAQAITDIFVYASDGFMKIITKDQINNLLGGGKDKLKNMINKKIPKNLQNFLK